MKKNKRKMGVDIMTIAEKHLITFISKSGIVLGVITFFIYIILGEYLDSFYGGVTLIFFSTILYMVKKKHIRYNTASILFSIFSIVIVTIGYVTALSIEEGLIYIVIPTIIITLLRKPKEAIRWLLPYYIIFLIINLMEIPNYNISITVFIQLFTIHTILFLSISYFTTQERRLSNKLVMMNKKLQKEATTDALTGAYNRRTFGSILNKAIMNCSKSDRDFVLGIIDIDFFKNINDKHGHLMGDNVLRELVNHLKTKIRKTDTIIRYGGEEFIVCLNCIEESMAMEIMEEIRMSIENMNFIKGEKMTVSIGVSRLVKGDTMTSVLLRADKALYRAKTEGRNRIIKG